MILRRDKKAEHAFSTADSSGISAASFSTINGTVITNSAF